jgi:hypothetical protein
MNIIQLASSIAERRARRRAVLQRVGLAAVAAGPLAAVLQPAVLQRAARLAARPVALERQAAAEARRFPAANERARLLRPVGRAAFRMTSRPKAI